MVKVGQCYKEDSVLGEHYHPYTLIYQITKVTYKVVEANIVIDTDMNRNTNLQERKAFREASTVSMYIKTKQWVRVEESDIILEMI